MKPASLEGLVRLTWITKSPSGRRGVKDVVDHISARTTTYSGLDLIFGTEVSDHRGGLLTARELVDRGVPREVALVACESLGIVNFYNGFRTRALSDWIRHHMRAIRAALGAAHDWGAGDEGRVEAARRIGRLPLIAKGGTTKGGCHPLALLSPVVMCLDPKRRFPMINNRVLRDVRFLGLADEATERQVRGYLSLLGWRRAGIVDAVDLDRYPEWWRLDDLGDDARRRVDVALGRE